MPMSGVIGLIAERLRFFAKKGSTLIIKIMPSWKRQSISHVEQVQVDQHDGRHCQLQQAHVTNLAL